MKIQLDAFISRNKGAITTDQLKATVDGITKAVLNKVKDEIFSVEQTSKGLIFKESELLKVEIKASK